MVKKFSLLIPFLTLVACATPPKYNWGNYSEALVTMDNDPATASVYTQSLEKIVNDPSGKIPPGVYAEYGYMLHIQNDDNGAAAMYAREKAAWPESTKLMDKLLLSLHGTPTVSLPTKFVS